MKKFIVAVFFALISSLVVAQSKAEQQVTQAVDDLKKAMIEGSRDQLNSIAAEKLSYGHSSGRVEDKNSFVETIASGKSDFVTINLTEQTISVSGKTAIVRHKLSAETNDGGKPGNVNIGVMLVFHKQSGDWKLLARQAFKL